MTSFPFHQSMRTTTIKCEACARGKGDLVQCEGSCGRFYHRLCLQIDCLDVVGWDAKKEHLCLRCRNVGDSAHPDPSAPFPLGGTSKVDCSQIKSSKAEVYNPQVKSSKKDAQGTTVPEGEHFRLLHTYILYYTSSICSFRGSTYYFEHIRPLTSATAAAPIGP